MNRIIRTKFASLTAAIFMLFTGAACGGPLYMTPEEADADPDFHIQGEYAADGWGAQVIARGHGSFEAFLLRGGLPGAGWVGNNRQRFESRRDGDITRFDADGLRLHIANEILIVSHESGDMIAQLPRVERVSSTIGLEPPEGAIVLFSGPEDADKWHNGRVDENGLLVQGVTSKHEFGDHRIHVEFLVPYRPHARGQVRGNSGIYVQARYEVQMLDSFGYEPYHGHNGGIYSVAAADLNPSYPPLRWQTYDIHFRAARFDGQGNKVEEARMTIYHNGIRVHENVSLPHTTTAAPIGEESAAPGPIFLQHHGDNQMRFRNIWVVDLGQ